MFADYHVHTEFSDDSEYEMEQVVKDAIAKGMDEICFTDHVDYGVKRDWDDPEGVLYRAGGPGEPDRMPVANVDYPAYAAKIACLREQYKDQITIRLGLEFGMQSHTVSDYEKLYSRYPFDFIILSVHEVGDKEFWNGDFQNGKTRDEVYAKYYEEMLYLVENYKNYSVLGHMDLISRYDPEGTYDFEKIRPAVTEILKTVIADGKGIEINSSSSRYGVASTPCREILDIYKELGGTIITVGSDSHKPKHLGFEIPETYEMMKQMGFTEVCTFHNMIPEFHEL